MGYFPDPLVIHLTAKHLRVRAKKNPLEQAVKDALKKAGVERKVITTEHSIRVMRVQNAKGHAARYFIPDALWRVIDRHSRGQPVHPGRFTLETIYVEDPAWTERDNKILQERKAKKESA